MLKTEPKITMKNGFSIQDNPLRGLPRNLFLIFYVLCFYCPTSTLLVYKPYESPGCNKKSLSDLCRYFRVLSACSFLRFALYSSDIQNISRVSTLQAVLIHVLKLQLADAGGSAVCGRSLSGIAGSNSTGGPDICSL